MLGWALLTLVFAIADYQINGFNAGPFVTAILTNIYLCKFFAWETGYFQTLDITLDRAGYYLCWGCLCWVQIFYTHVALFMVGHPSQISNNAAFTIFAYGLVSIILNYAVDRQKEIFRNNNGKCQIWGRPAKYVVSLGFEIKSGPDGNYFKTFTVDLSWNFIRFRQRSRMIKSSSTASMASGDGPETIIQTTFRFFEFSSLFLKRRLVLILFPGCHGSCKT
jgi:hypothetical protein